MKDIGRIDRILNYIRALWILNPNLRLGQLLYNYGKFTDADYNRDDDITEEFLRQYYERYRIKRTK
jgi:hypothetical protein